MSSFEQKTTITKTTVTRQTEQPVEPIVLVPVIGEEVGAPVPPPSSCESVCGTSTAHEKHHQKGVFEKIKEAFTGGDNPVKNAEKYAKKVGYLLRFFNI